MVRAALLAALVLAVLACPSYLREPVCGDGVAEGAERCDDANALSGDGCSSSCLVEEGWYCTEPGADVDFAQPPPSTDGGTSGVDPTDCWPITHCGDAVVEGSEQCDDGNTTSNDGCHLCLWEAGWDCDAGACTHCGDGVIEGSELCDDGNATSDDGCHLCRWEAGWYCDGGTCTTQCGDGVIAGDEPCDDGNDNDEDGCTTQCEGQCAPVGESCGTDLPCCGPYGICVTSQGDYCDGGSCHCEMILP